MESSSLKLHESHVKLRKERSNNELGRARRQLKSGASTEHMVFLDIKRPVKCTARLRFHMNSICRDICKNTEN
jgi:hypothetical protein